MVFDALLSKVFMASTVIAVGYGVAQHKIVKSQDAQITNLHVQNALLESNLIVAEVRLNDVKTTLKATADALSLAEANSRETEAIKDWVNGQEDADIPDWFIVLLARLGVGLWPDGDRTERPH